MVRFSRLARVGGSVATMTLAGSLVAAAPAWAAETPVVWTDSSSQSLSYTVLAGTCPVTLDVRGASGGGSLGGIGGLARNGTTAGGRGGQVVVAYATSAGDLFEGGVGGLGGDDNLDVNATPGRAGVTAGAATGGAGGADTVGGVPGYVAAGGGGLSVVSVNGTYLAIAGGGGGAANSANGGDGGAPGAGGESDGSAYGGGGGGGSVPGTSGGGNAETGGFLTGGAGASISGSPGVDYMGAGGGGGAGYFGGGGGGNQAPNHRGGAGGGGSNFVGSGVTAVTSTTGPGGSGQITLTPNACGSVPGAPTGVTVSPRDRSLLVRFTMPAGDPDATYQFSTDDGQHWSGLAGDFVNDAVTATITGLTNGTTYTVLVRAVGDGGPGEPADGVDGTPLAPAPSPSSVTAVAGVSSATVSWPASIGDGAAVTGYTVTASPGPATCETTALSCVLGGEAGVAYTYAVVAHSASGDSPAVPTAEPVTPAMPVPPAVPPAGAFDLTTTDGAISTAEPGQRITFVGTGFVAFSTMVLSIYSDPVVLSAVVTNAGGSFRRTIIVPADLAAGTHTILAQGVDAEGTPRYLSVAVTVAADDTAAPGQSLPVTGGTPWLVALLLIFSGLILRTVPSLRRG